MNEYLKTVVSAVFAVGIISAIFPKDSFGKYINILASVLVLAVILSPVLNISKNDIDFDRIDTKKLELDVNTYIMEEYEKELAQNIRERLKEETNLDFSVVVYADKEEDVINIDKIELSPYTSKASHIVSEYLGIPERSIVEK